jgi:TonB-linked SusC/RagA family outer membrane protein
VLVEGTTLGVVTDAFGKYSLELPSQNAVLVFSFVGYNTERVQVSGRSQVSVTLVPDIKTLEEVVVTALGIKRSEKALGYAVQKVTGEDLTTVKGIDVETSLTGKVSGLMVQNSTEFASEASIQIRGENPLLVIDGVPYGNMSLRDVPSDDIENISVLKGATASALYGYRGASGAIMITTRKGSAHKGLSVSVNSSSMFSAGYLAIPELESTYGRAVNTATNTYTGSDDGSWGVPMDGREVIQWDPISKSFKAMPYLPVGKDNFKNFLEQGYILNNNVSVVQQGEYGSLRASATWVQNKGEYPNSMFDKMTYSVGGDMKIKKFTLSSSMTYNKNASPNIGFSGYTGYDPMYSLLIWSSPDWDLRNYKDYWVVPNEVQNTSYTSGVNNPYFDRYQRIHSLNKDILNGTISMDYEVSSWLKATLRTGYDTYSDREVIQVSKGSFQGAGSATVIPNGSQVWGESKRGSFNLGLSRGYSINNDFILSANRNIRDFVLDGFVGGAIYYGQDEGIETLTQGGLSIPAFYSLKASVNPVAVASNIYKRQVNSLYGRFGVSWKNMIFAEGTLRNDWVSTLPESTRSYIYPSLSGSFIASELLKQVNWLSLWKLRGSWVSVKMPAGIYDINSVFSISNNAWGNLSTANYPTSIRGTDVRPESSTTFEIGTLVNVFQNRASLDVSYYNKRMFDFLRSAGISPASGFTSNYVNTDEVISRKGVEVTATVTPVKTQDLRWDVSVNWSKYARYYTQLDSVYSQDRPWVKEGERADAYVLRDYQKDPQGNIIFNNGLPLYSAYDSRYGYSDPDWIWGAGTSLNYKNWVLNVSVDGRVGGLTQTITEMYMWRAGSHPNSVVPERYLDATQPGTKNYTGQGVKVVSGSATYDTYGNITNDTRVYAANDVAVTYKSYIESLHKGTAWGGAASPVDVYSTTFFKIREISLTYRLPQSWSSRFYCKGASVSAVGQNVFLWARDFKYSDPDGGTENFSDPSLRYVGLNVKLDF